jgi:hypothetical protein
MKMTRRNSEGSDMESAHLPHAIMLVLMGEKPKGKKRKRAGSAAGTRLDRGWTARGGRQAVGCRQRRRW